MCTRIMLAFVFMSGVITAHAHPGHPALSPQHVHVGTELDVAWLGLTIVVALLALAGIGRSLARNVARRRR